MSYLVNPYRYAISETTWQEQDEGTLSTYIWSQKSGENWQYGVQNDTGDTQTS